MSLYGSYRLMNAIENGTLTGAQLQTALTGSSRSLGDFNALMDNITAKRRLGRSPNAIGAIFDSAKALATLPSDDSTFYSTLLANADTRAAILGYATRMAALGNTASQYRLAPYWTPVSRGSANAAFNMVWTGQNFVTVNASSAYTSSDGITWTSRTQANTSTGFSGMASDGSGSVVAGAQNRAAASSLIYSSDHGVTWSNTGATSPGPANKGVVGYINGTWFSVAFAAATTSIHYTTSPGSAASWFASTIGSSTLYDAATGTLSTGPKRAVIVGASVSFYSDDGVTWTAGSIPAKTYLSVTFGNGKFVAVASDGTSAYSTDGITFTAGGSLTDLLGAGQSIGRVRFGGGMFIATHGSSANYFWYSTDGINWTRSNSVSATNVLPSSSIWAGVAFNNGVWAFGHTGAGRATNF